MTCRARRKNSLHTLGGFVMHVLGRIPQAADHFSVAGLRFEVMDMDRNRVDKVLVSAARSTARRQAAEPATVGDIAAIAPNGLPHLGRQHQFGVGQRLDELLIELQHPDRVFDNSSVSSRLPTSIENTERSVISAAEPAQQDSRCASRWQSSSSWRRLIMPAPRSCSSDSARKWRPSVGRSVSPIRCSSANSRA